jgi:hypothetical protein
MKAVPKHLVHSLTPAMADVARRQGDQRMHFDDKGPYHSDLLSRCKNGVLSTKAGSARLPITLATAFAQPSARSQTT